MGSSGLFLFNMNTPQKHFIDSAISCLKKFGTEKDGVLELSTELLYLSSKKRSIRKSLTVLTTRGASVIVKSGKVSPKYLRYYNYITIIIPLLCKEKT